MSNNKGLFIDFEYGDKGLIWSYIVRILIGVKRVNDKGIRTPILFWVVNPLP